MPCIQFAAGAAVSAIITELPGTNDLPVWIVRDLVPTPIERLVVLVAFVPGAATAAAALAAASVTVFPATATTCARAGTNRVRCPPLARPVLALLSSVTVEPSPPTLGG